MSRPRVSLPTFLRKARRGNYFFIPDSCALWFMCEGMTRTQHNHCDAWWDDHLNPWVVDVLSDGTAITHCIAP